MGVMVKSLDYGILVIEFEVKPFYYLHSQANILGKGMNPLVLTDGLNCTTTVLLKGFIGH